jgi:CheY-like chemotaxis protein
LGIEIADLDLTPTFSTGRMKMETSRYKVLVVDDNESVRNLVVTSLSREGHQCTAAADATKALEKACEEKLDAVISDIVMPGVDGITLTRELLKRYHKLPVMIMTGHADEYSAEDAVAAGAREFIKKPFSIAEFTIRFHKMMRDHETLGQLEAKKNEIIFTIHAKFKEKVGQLEKQVKNLTSRLSSV